MKTLYIECNMGAAGDMLAAALAGLLDWNDGDTFFEELNRIVPKGVTVRYLPDSKCGLEGNRVEVTVNGSEETSEDVVHDHAHDEHEHPHKHEHPSIYAGEHEHGNHSLDSIEHTVSHLAVSDCVRDDILAVYRLIADAESAVHGKPVEQVHFHEVGSLDAVADITAVCLLMEKLSSCRVVVSPIHVGSGMVRCAHGILPVPAPATAVILKDVPVYGGNIRGELCTPTGAALLRHFAGSFGPMPRMTVSRIGIGMGKKDFEAANCVRAFLGDDGHAAGSHAAHSPNGRITELSCNVDDMTGEAVGFASEVMLREGALDFYTVPIQMKKNRPGFMLVCLCGEDDSDRMAALMLRHTTTFGIRKKLCERYTLGRTFTEEDTPYGKIRIKHGAGYGAEKCKPEYEDLKRAAEENNLSLPEVYTGSITKDVVI
ncbi:MAG: nickel pincer cofactor biosynthesis protein LarC [Eubacteriales bacterium]